MIFTLELENGEAVVGQLLATGNLGVLMNSNDYFTVIDMHGEKQTGDWSMVERLTLSA